MARYRSASNEGNVGEDKRRICVPFFPDLSRQANRYRRIFNVVARPFLSQLTRQFLTVPVNTRRHAFSPETSRIVESASSSTTRYKSPSTIERNRIVYAVLIRNVGGEISIEMDVRSAILVNSGLIALFENDGMIIRCASSLYGYVNQTFQWIRGWVTLELNNLIDSFFFFFLNKIKFS